MKKKYIWKLYSGADWYLRELANTVAYAFAFASVGGFLCWLVNVG